MGEHKHNPTAIMAKEGKLQSHKPSMSKRKRELLLQNEIIKKLGFNTLYTIIERKY